MNTNGNAHSTPVHGPSLQGGEDIWLVDAELIVPDDARIANYRGVVEMASGYLDARPAPVPELSEAQAFPLPVRQAYRDWLFHGPRWQVIEDIPGIAAGGLAAHVRPSAPADLLSVGVAGTWCVDPGLLDAAAQLAILWCRWRWDMTCLPVSIANLRIYGRELPGPVRCELRVRPGSEPPAMVADYWFVDAGGRVLATIEGFEHAASTSLNALTGQAQRDREGVSPGVAR
jgi:hypothetical protein